MKHAILTALATLAAAPLAHAEIVWTGALGPNIFEEGNWDFSGSTTVTMLDPNVPIDDDIRFSAIAQPARVPNLGGGQFRFEVAEGHRVLIDGMRVWSGGDDGFGSVPGASTGIRIDVRNGGLFEPFFIVNSVALDIDGTSRVVFGGGGNPINLSTVNLTLGSSLEFLLEDPTEFMNEHLSKVTVDGVAAAVGVNIEVASDGAQGSIVTVIPQDVGSNYCMANANSSGVPAVMSAFGSPAVSANMLRVECSDMPQLVFGFFLVSRTQGFVANPAGSAGNLCVAGAIGRYVGPGQIQNSGGMGRIALDLDLSALPQPNGFVVAASGESWNFQAWFRDAASGGGVTSNFSDGLFVQLL